MNDDIRKSRRWALLTVAALGGSICLLGGSILFSALQDTARTGTNSVESGALAASADIQLAHGSFGAGQIDCGPFSEDLTSALVSASGVSPGFISVPSNVCIKNVGSQQVTLSGLADELVDLDFACTGDEEAHGDTTCGADGAGELSSILRVSYSIVACDDLSNPANPAAQLDENATTPVPLGNLGPGATACYQLTVAYPFGLPNAEVQRAQTDRATWRFRFTGQA